MANQVLYAENDCSAYYCIDLLNLHKGASVYLTDS